VDADYAVLAELSKGLSDEDILNVCVNAIYAGSTDIDTAKWRVMQAMLQREIAKAKKAKVEHAGKEAGPKDWVLCGVIGGETLADGFGVLVGVVVVRRGGHSLSPEFFEHELLLDGAQ
jgi:hypothetical protein